jgi:hypothetical protein
MYLYYYVCVCMGCGCKSEVVPAYIILYVCQHGLYLVVYMLVIITTRENSIILYV